MSVPARLNRTLCWYLTCDRYYWHFPLDGGSGSKQRGSMSTLDGITWGFFILLFLSLSFFLVFAYYLVWICF